MNLSKLYRAAALLTTVVAVVGCGADEGDAPVSTAQDTTSDGIDVVRSDAAGSGWDLLVEYETYCADGACADVCTPDCAGLECGGDDGCGSSCGSCAVDQDCVAGACQDPPLSFCAIKCSQPGDCDAGGGGAYSGDNYVCEGGYCEYSGCNTDAECSQTYANDSYGCYAGAGYPIPYCTLKCTQAADCDLGVGGAYAAANYNCDSGYCEYVGCNSDAECEATFNDDKYGCYMGPGFLVAYCSLKCTQAADCDQGTGGAFSADNYLCKGGFCEYTGCTSDAECAESYNNSNYGCN